MENQRWRTYANFLVSENLWRAQRYGVEDRLIDFGKGVLVPFPELVEELIALVKPDAEELGCLAEVEHIRTICRRGTSADHQLAVYHQALESGESEAEAMHRVVDTLITNTIAKPSDWV
jgi:carboxylate-amine ligase